MTYALMAVLTLLAALWLTRPLWRAELPRLSGRRAANVQAYQSRLSEIETETAGGLLKPEAATALRRELDARLLADAQEADLQAPVVPRRRLAAVALALVFALAGGAWYALAGSWRQADAIALAASAPAGKAQPAEVQAMVGKLEARMAAQPDDAAGWALLGRSYFVMQRYEDSAKAYGKANALTLSPVNPEWLTDEGEALTMARDRDLLGRPAQLFEAALDVAPDYGKALWYGGLAAAQGKDYGKARGRFEALLKQELPEEVRVAVLGRLEELSALSESARTSPSPSEAGRGAGERAAHFADKETITEGSTGPLPKPLPPKAGEGGKVRLTLNLSLKPGLAGKVPADAVLFVFAKAAQGPPMPLAVQRIPGATLPLTVSLDDSMGMTPALRLSQFERWVVTARLSKSGSAQASSGDVQGQISLSKAEAGQPQALELDQVLP